MVAYNKRINVCFWPKADVGKNEIGTEHTNQKDRANQE